MRIFVARCLLLGLSFAMTPPLDVPSVPTPPVITSAYLANLSKLSDAELLAYDDAKLDILFSSVQLQQSNLNNRVSTLTIQIQANTDHQIVLQDQITLHESKIAHIKAQEIMLARYLYAQPDNLPLLFAASESFSAATDAYSSLSIAGLRAHAFSKELQSETVILVQERKSALEQARQYEILKTELLDQLQVFISFQDQITRLKVLFKERRAKIIATISSGPSTILEIITKAFAPLGPDALVWAIRIGKCESGYNPLAVNASSGAMGLFQFLPATWKGSPYKDQNPFDPSTNASAAAWLFHRSGPNQWECK